jgi:hypothetical protein
LLSVLDYTEEFQRLAAVQGLLLDADGSVWFNWFDEFGFTQPAEIAFNLDAKTEYSLRPIINALVRSMARSSKGAFTTRPRSPPFAATASSTHSSPIPMSKRPTRTGRMLSSCARAGHFRPFPSPALNGSTTRFDDNTTIKIPDDKVKFFRSTRPACSKRPWRPAKAFDWINTPGKERYVLPIFDRDRNAWWRMEAYEYPLFICKRPEVLRTGKQGA